MPEASRSSDIQYSSLPAEEREKSAWKRFKNKWLRMDKLFFWTLLGVFAGMALGVGLYHTHCSNLTIELIGYLGEMMLRALEELILPLIVFSLMVGIMNLRHTPGGAGRIVQWSLFYYILSMLLAVGVGIALVESIKPGKHMTFISQSSTSCSSNSTTTSPTSYQLQASTTNSTSSSQFEASQPVVESLLNIGRNFIPKNLIAAAALPNYLGIIMFSVVFAAGVSTMGERAEPLISLIELCNQVILKIILCVIAFAPIGVASLIASTILKACDLGGLLKALGLYVGTVLLGFLIHGAVVLPMTMFLMSGQNPWRAFKGFLPALLMGLGTSSSAATMPITMKCSEDVGCSPSIVQFVIPLGTNINRDGAALYEAVSVIFILQANGVSMTAGNIVIVVITATLAAIGSVSIPNGALVTMITVLQALNYPQFIPDVAILFAVDWLLGTLRTSLNIWGDACAVVIVDTWVRQFAKKHDMLPVTANNSTSIQLPHRKDQEPSESSSHAKV